MGQWTLDGDWACTTDLTGEVQAHKASAFRPRVCIEQDLREVKTGIGRTAGGRTHLPLTCSKFDRLCHL